MLAHSVIASANPPNSTAAAPSPSGRGLTLRGLFAGLIVAAFGFLMIHYFERSLEMSPRTEGRGRDAIEATPIGPIVRSPASVHRPTASK